MRKALTNIFVIRLDLRARLVLSLLGLEEDRSAKVARVLAQRPT